MTATAERSRTAERMRARLADALWGCLETRRLSEISVGDVIEAAGVSRGSFYYHFADLDELVEWSLRQELLDSDRMGHSFMALAAQEDLPDETPAVSRSIERACLLLDRGGMSNVYDVTLDVVLDLWSLALSPGGAPLPDEAVAQLEYAVGGTVGMLSRARESTASKRRASISFLHERHLWLVRRMSDVLGKSPRELAALLERARAGAGA